MGGAPAVNTLPVLGSTLLAWPGLRASLAGLLVPDGTWCRPRALRWMAEGSGLGPALGAMDWGCSKRVMGLAEGQRRLCTRRVPGCLAHSRPKGLAGGMWAWSLFLCGQKWGASVGDAGQQWPMPPSWSKGVCPLALKGTGEQGVGVASLLVEQGVGCLFPSLEGCSAHPKEVSEGIL